MKVKGLDGKEYSWYLVGYEASLNETKPRSELHVSIRALLKSMFSGQKLLEEVPLPGTKLYADFYLPQLGLIVEAHGRQHYEYVPHFHGSTNGFIASKKRDSVKADWCQLNKIHLAICSYKETEDEWRREINKIYGE